MLPKIMKSFNFSTNINDINWAETLLKKFQPVLFIRY